MKMSETRLKIIKKDSTPNAVGMSQVIWQIVDVAMGYHVLCDCRTEREAQIIYQALQGKAEKEKK